MSNTLYIYSHIHTHARCCVAVAEYLYKNYADSLFLSAAREEHEFSIKLTCFGNERRSFLIYCYWDCRSQSGKRRRENRKAGNTRAKATQCVFCGAVAVFSQLARSIGGFIGLPRTHGDNNAIVLWRRGAHTKLVLLISEIQTPACY